MNDLLAYLNKVWVIWGILKIVYNQKNLYNYSNKWLEVIIARTNFWFFFQIFIRIISFFITSIIFSFCDILTLLFLSFLLQWKLYSSFWYKKWILVATFFFSQTTYKNSSILGSLKLIKSILLVFWTLCIL